MPIAMEDDGKKEGKEKEKDILVFTLIMPIAVEKEGKCHKYKLHYLKPYPTNSIYSCQIYLYWLRDYAQIKKKRHSWAKKHWKSKSNYVKIMTNPHQVLMPNFILVDLYTKNIDKSKTL